jgi:hypothetical protein
MLHRHVDAPIRKDAEVEHTGQRGVLHTDDDASLLAEPRDERRLLGVTATEDLDDARPTELDVLGLETSPMLPRPSKRVSA